MSSSVVLKKWLTDHGGYFNPHARFQDVASGSCIIASQNIPADSTIVSCPFKLVITRNVALDALSALLDSKLRASLDQWSARQLISSYLSFHEIVGDRNSSSILAHHAYIDTLPSPDKLRTPLHFTSTELELLKGSNLHGATIDRERDWRLEWEACQALVATCNAKWAERFSWERYLTAATHLSSRAFPSTLLSKTPSLVSQGDTEPILLPAIDALNHAFGEPVSWVSNYVGTEAAPGPGSSISITLHNAIPFGAELCNNYGPKLNAELILGYGFSLPDNPNDTIVLKIGGIAGRKWEVGRNARGAEGVWESVLKSVVQENEATYEDYLDASSMLSDMVQTLLEKLPDLPPVDSHGVREDVVLMIQHYIQGQRDILEGLIEFASSKEAIGVSMAEEQGIEIVLE